MLTMAVSWVSDPRLTAHTNSVTANADELVSNNNKAVAVPVRSDLVGTERSRRELNGE
jgi:hypothetical protein